MTFVCEICAQLIVNGVCRNLKCPSKQPPRVFGNAGAASAAAKLINSDYAGRTDADNGTEAVKILAMISGQEGDQTLTGRDREFITDMRGKSERCKGVGFVCSRRQLNWLRDINERLLGGG